MLRKYRNYFVYDDGRIWSCRRKTWLKPQVDRGGYLYVVLYDNGLRERWFVHRLVATVFLSNDLGLPQVNHINGDKTDNHVSNLEWCTAFRNNKHARDTGLNDISKSNRARWSRPENRARLSQLLKEAHCRDNWSSGKRNGNWKYALYWNGISVERKDLPSLMNRSQSRCDAIVAKIAKSNYKHPNLTVVNAEGQSTIEKV